MKTAQLFRIKNPKYASDSVFASRELAEAYCGFYPHQAGEIEGFTGQLFETGDQISVELHRGGIDDDDGIHRGGGWVRATGVVTITGEVAGLPGGWIADQDGRHIQSMVMVAGISGFPFRDAQLEDKPSPRPSPR